MKTVHVQEVRTAIDALVLPARTYTNHPLQSGDVVRAVHISELRGGVQ
jgi:hypothetical protein